MFEIKKPKVFNPTELKKMSRPELNSVAMLFSLMPPDDMDDDEIITQIQQRQREEVRKYNDRVAAGEKKAAERKKKKEVADDQPEPEPDPEPEPEPESEPPVDDRVWFRVAAGSSALEQADVFASLNGESILIKRGHWIKLKKKFLPVFRDAIITMVEITKEGDKVARDVPRFNYSVRSLEEGMPPEPSALSVRAF